MPCCNSKIEISPNVVESAECNTHSHILLLYDLSKNIIIYF
jgi:hypothetical protein